ncbi:hypothetical protein NCS52_00168800 [Fusarium sp. LHS14.1]|nr:hypothetical protein NCS52_00168800 [Fusarium sp. LHS14.1]
MEPNPPDHPLIDSLFNAILDSCVNAYQRLKPDEQSRRLRSESERLFLWGDGVSANGQLSEALPMSSELYQTVLSALYELGKVVDVDLAQVISASRPNDPAADTRELRLLLETAGVILGVPNATEDFESLSDDENGPSKLEDVLDDMAIYINCLMDLSSTLQNVLAYPESISIEPAIIELNEMKPARTSPPRRLTFGNSNRSYVGLERPHRLPHLQATITLFEGTPRELVVHLGPWEVQESNERRVIWQGVNQDEVLEHYFPSSEPSDLHPHTLHNRHRPYNDPADMERYITFREPHRIRYITGDGVCIHDELIEMKYEFSSAESSVQFQGDLRRKDLVDFYDADVVWTNIHGRTNSFGNVRGVATLQRLKLWRDRLTGLYSLSINQNNASRQYVDYYLKDFHAVGIPEDRARELQLETLRQNNDKGHRPVTANRLQLGKRGSEASESRLQRRSTDNIRYLAIKFSERAAFRQFIKTWQICKNPDNLSNQPQLSLGEPMPAYLAPEQLPRDAMSSTPGPSNLTETTGSSGRQE